MRRPFALLALLSMSWFHVAAFQCALGSGGSPHGHEGAPDHHGAPIAHELDAGLSAHSSAPLSGGTACAMVMACGMAMTETPLGTTELEPPAATASIRPASRDAPASAFASHDPPPPRRLV